jgi:hypothetical protein
MNEMNMDEERMSAALVAMADALGVDPAAMIVVGGSCPEGMVLHILIVPDTETVEQVPEGSEEQLINEVTEYLRTV